VVLAAEDHVGLAERPRQPAMTSVWGVPWMGIQPSRDAVGIHRPTSSGSPRRKPCPASDHRSAIHAVSAAATPVWSGRSSVLPGGGGPVSQSVSTLLPGLSAASASGSPSPIASNRRLTISGKAKNRA